MTYKTGDLIYFAEEKRPYRIKACDGRFLVCTKPFNLKKTVQYTIVDLKKNIRGADNYWRWGGYFDYGRREECVRTLKALNDGTVDEKPFGISHHFFLELDIVGYKH